MNNNNLRIDYFLLSHLSKDSQIKRGNLLYELNQLLTINNNNSIIIQKFNEFYRVTELISHDFDALNEKQKQCIRLFILQKRKASEVMKSNFDRIFAMLAMVIALVSLFETITQYSSKFGIYLLMFLVSLALFEYLISLFQVKKNEKINNYFNLLLLLEQN